MPAEIVGYSTAARADGGQTLTLTVPPGTTTGDVLVVTLRGQTGVAPWTTPDGWAAVGPAWVGGADQRANQILAHTVAATDPTRGPTRGRAAHLRTTTTSALPRSVVFSAMFEIPNVWAIACAVASRSGSP